MYKDNGKINVELLAEVGDIAHRIRNLDEKLDLNLDDPNRPEPTYNFYRPTAPAAPASEESAANCSSDIANQCTDASSSERRPSAAQIAQDISERISGTATTSDSTAQRRYSTKQLEDIILEFYEQHLIYHRNQEKEQLIEAQAGEPRRSRIFQLTSNSDSTMNTGLSTKTTSNHGNNDGNVAVDSSCNRAIESAASETAGELLATNIEHSPVNSGGKRNSIANQQMPEIQISNSDEQMKPRRSIAELPEFDYNDDRNKSRDATSTSGGICSHYCAGWQPTAFGDQLNDDDLQSLVMELKRKIEFTERMNWLCKYEYNSFFLNSNCLS